MEEPELKKILIQYNSLYKETDETYHALARHYGLSDCAFWILYIIRESDQPLTQSEICEHLSLSKQTVNSALKKLEKDGYLHLESPAGNLKSKLVLFSEKGEALAGRTVDTVMKMELHALGLFSSQERTAFLRLNQQYTRHLQLEAEKILTTR